MKTIWIINEYAGSPYHGMVFRHYYLAKEWIKQGYNVYIISASYSHYLKKFPNMECKSYKLENIDGIKYLWLKVPKYKTSNDKKRVLKWFVFTFKLFFLPKIEKPDIIISSPTAPFSIIPSYFLAKKYKAKFIFEVRDIWPLSVIELGNINKNNPLIRFMSFCEKFAIKKSDYLVSTLQNYDKYLKDINIKKDFFWINNGIDLDEMKKIESLPIDVENKIPKNKFIVGYTGTIGIANSIEHLLKSAEFLQNNKNIHFIIVGDGKEKENLVKKYSYLKNVTFIRPIKKQQVQSMLKLFDVCYIGLQNKSLFKYGVSPNKLFDYMYSGKPILYAINSGKNNIVELANCGISVSSENSKAISEGILKIYNMNNEKRKILGKNGKKYVLKYFIYEKLALKYKKVVVFN